MRCPTNEGSGLRSAFLLSDWHPLLEVYVTSPAKGLAQQVPQMEKDAEAFMDAWLDANVSRKHARKPSDRTIKALANRCMRDGSEAGISLERLEEVVIDIEDAITDELNFLATQKADER